MYISLVGLVLRWMVMKEIWKLLVAAFVTFSVTLLVFPGLVSLVQNCYIGDWTPILLVAVFNVPDLIAKVCDVIYIFSFIFIYSSVGSSTSIQVVIICTHDRILS